MSLSGKPPLILPETRARLRWHRLVSASRPSVNVSLGWIRNAEPHRNHHRLVIARIFSPTVELS
jgi:hypothetical protein